MKKSAPARIINTTAAAYQLGEIGFDDMNFERREYTPAKGYSQAKLAVALFTVQFARKFKVEGKTTNTPITVELQWLTDGSFTSAVSNSFLNPWEKSHSCRFGIM